MKRLLMMCVCCLCLSPAWAQRFLPQDMDMAVMKAAQYPTVVLSADGFSWLKILTLGWLDRSTQFQLSPAVRIRDESNRFIVYGKLPEHAGKAVAVRRDPQNNINEIWILTAEEREVYRQRAREKEAQAQ